MIIFKIPWISISNGNTIVDQFNTNDDEVFEPNMKVKCNYLWFNPLINEYPDELQTLVQVMNDSILTHALTTSFVVLMK